jgi:PAS domain S-box-containing protein
MSKNKPSYQELEKRVRELERKLKKGRRAEGEPLRATEVLFRSIFYEAPSVIIFLSADCRILEFNPEAEHIYGRKRDEVLGKNYLELFIPEDAWDAVAADIEKVLEGEPTKGFENVIIAHDGNEHILRWDVNQVQNSEDKPIGVMAIGQDITELRKSETSLKESEDKLDSIVRTVPDIIYRLDSLGNLVFVSDAVKRYGYKPEEVIGKSIMELVHSDDLEKALYKISERRTGDRSTKTLELRLIAKDKSVVPFELRSKGEEEPVFIIAAEGLYTAEKPGATTFLGTQGIARDISERKEMEKALEESESKYRSIIENIPYVTWTSDKNGKTTFISPNIEAIYGYTPEEIYEGGASLWLDRIHPEDIDRVKAGYNALFEKKKAFNEEYRIRRKDGSWIWLHDKASLMLDKDSIEYGFGVFADITERKRAEEELKKTNERIQLAMEAAWISTWEYETKTDKLAFTFGDDNLYDYSIDTLKKHVKNIHPDDVPLFQKEVDDILTGRNSLYHCEYRLRFKSGEYRWVLIVGKVFEHDKNGAPVSVHGITMDIDKRKRAEEKLRESNERLEHANKELREMQAKFEAVYNHHYQMTGLMDKEGRLLMGNKAALEFAGVGAQEVIGKHFWETPWWTHSQEEQNKLREAMERAMQGEMVHFETTHVTSVGETRNIDFRIRPVFDDKGELIYLVPEGYDITDRKRAEETLKHSEERLKLALRGGNIGFWDWNVKTDEAYFDQRWIEMLGYSVGEIKPSYDTWENLLHPDDKAEIIKRLNAHFEDEKVPYEVETRLRAKSGEWMWIFSKGEVVERDANGEPVRMSGTHFDISERKRAEENLSEREELFRSLFEGSRDGIVFVTENGKVVDCNKSYRKMLGYSLKELKSMNFFQFTPEKWHDWEQAEILEKQLPQKGYSDTYEKEYIHKDGTVFPVELNAYKLTEKIPGNAITYWAVVRDITKRKQAEEALRESEATIRSVFSAAPVGICIMKNRVYQSANKNWCESFGYPEESILGKTTRFLYENDEEYQRAGQELYKQLLERGLTSVETRLRRSDGVFRDVVLIAAPLQPDDLKAGTVVVINDVTEQKQAEESLRESEETARALLNAPSERLILMDIEGNTLDLNENMLKSIGKTRKELIGNNVFDFFPPDLAEQRRSYGNKVVRSGKPVSFEDEREGMFLSNTIYPLFGPTGKVERLAVYSMDITEKKLAEEKLRESELRYRMLFETAGNSIFHLHDDKFINCNEKTLELFGCTKDQIIGSSPYFYSPPKQPDGRDSKEKALEKIKAAYEGDPQSFEWKHIKYDGTPFDAEVNLNMVEIGGDFLIQAIVRDISERKRSEVALRESEEKFRTVFENAPIGIALSTPDGMVFAVNQTVLNLYELDKSDIGNITAKQFYYNPEDRERILNILKKEGKVQGYETMQKRKDGSTFWITMNVSLYEYSGETVLLVTLVDITDRKLVEEALRESEERYRTIYNSLPIPVWEIDCSELRREFEKLKKQGVGDIKTRLDQNTEFVYDIIKLIKILDINNAALHTYKAKSKEDIIMNLEKMLFPQNLQGAKDNITAMVEGKSHFGIEEAIKTLEGNILSLLTNSVFFQDAKGRDILLISQVDITALRKAEKERSEALRMADQASRLASLGTLAAGIAHEINQPLNAIKVTSDSFLFWEKKNKIFERDRIKQDFTLVSEQADKIDDIIQHMRGLIYQEKKLTSTDLNSVIQKALSFVGKQLKSHGIGLQLKLDKSLPLVKCQPTLMEQVTINLVVNAMHALGEYKSADKQVVLSTRHEDENCILDVLDNGPGIPPENLDKIFDPFFTTKTGGVGLGFGLSIVFNIIKGFGGTISVKNRDEGGAHFTVLIPAITEDSSED